MLIENDNHYRTLYVVVRLSELDLKTWILSFSFETITENENGYRFQKFSTIFKSFPQPCGKPSGNSLGIRLL